MPYGGGLGDQRPRGSAAGLIESNGPEKIYGAMSSGGKMLAQAAALTDRDKRSFAEFLAGHAIADRAEAVKMTDACRSNPALPSRLDASPG
jgi:hypothetical protein